MEKEYLALTGITYFDISLRRTAKPEQHAHDFHEFFFNYEPGGEQLSGEQRTSMRQGDLYFYPAGQRHIGNGDCHGGVIYVGVEAFSPFVAGENEATAVLQWLIGQAGKDCNLIPLSPDGRVAVRRVFELLLEEFRRGGGALR